MADATLHRGDLQIKKRYLPHWRIDGSGYFVTFRVFRGFLSAAEIKMVRQHIIDGSGRFYHLSAVCVMPDHVHIVLSPNEGISLSRIMQGIKGASARLINTKRRREGRLWQVESWDRIIRDDAELREKLGYMLQNPVKAGLTDVPWAWPGWYLNPQEKCGD